VTLVASAFPLVSVLMPVRDVEAHIDEAISSILAQTLADFELIIVDDGSTDDTRALISVWAARDVRVRYLSQEPSGIVPALEAARHAARGRFLARMDGDDVSMPTRLEKQVKLLEEEPRLAGCGTGIEYFPAHVVRDGARRYEQWINATVTPDEIAREIFVECPLAHPTFFLRAEALDSVGGYREVAWPEDYDLVFRLWERGARLGKVAEPLLRWREGEERLSRVHARYSAHAFRRCKVHYLSRTLLKRRSGAVVWGSGPVGKGFSMALREAGVDVRAFVDVDPRKIGQNIHGTRVVGAEEALAMSGVLHLAAVGQPGGRDGVREVLSGAGLVELNDFVALA
jgi:glycosyltransferase involved in cell wall biosynthesis